MRRLRGFTLIEIMITVAIVGILAALAVPAWGTFIAKSRQTEAKAGLLAIESLEKSFHGENRRYGSLVEIGFVMEGRGRYAFRSGSGVGDSVFPAGGNVNFGGSGGGGFTPTCPTCGSGGPGSPETLGPGSGGGGGGGIGPGSGTGGKVPFGGLSPGGNAHHDGDSFEAVATGVISTAPPPRDIDVWSVDQTRTIVNIGPGY